MPLYMYDFEEGTLSTDQKAAIAQEIANVHCKVTGAPASFVHTMFSPHKSENCFVGAKLERYTVVVGNIRDGRSDTDKQKLLGEITKACVRIAGVNAEEFVVYLNDVPAKYIMEGGRIIPEPGHEDEWLAKGRTGYSR
jgi:phenylpyruvate tautomerase PptA (4-oxalocrotonate tautomerase family)